MTFEHRPFVRLYNWLYNNVRVSDGRCDGALKLVVFMLYKPVSAGIEEKE